MDQIDAYWIWLGVGLVFLILELLTGTFFLIWTGLAALALALLAYLAPALAVHWQLVVFAVIAVVTTYLGRTYLRGLFGQRATDRPTLNRRSDQLAGRSVVAIDAFVGGEGRVRLGDSQWAARLEPAPSGLAPAIIAAGDALTILRIEGATLIVAPA